jgi:fatty-acyl-CoA synthase
VTETITRHDVEAAATAQAAVLQGLGVGPGDAVGWLAFNSSRALALLEACRRLGARYVPLNPRLAAPELSALVRHAGLHCLLHDEANGPLAASVRALAACPQPRAPGHVAGDLMLVYTSGTTGDPKGAVHTAEGMQANIAAAIDCQQFGPGTRTLAVLPLFHVGGLCIQVLPTLAAGGTVRLHMRFDPQAWFDDVAAWRPHTSLLVPAAMKALIEHPRWRDADLASLCFVSAGSQIVPAGLIRAFHERGVPVTQVYGATETGPVSIVLRPEEAMAHVGRCGRPARGVQVRLGEQGEVLLRAPNLMRTYHRAGAPPLDSEGWFATGDLAVQHDDGFYEIVGRRKELIISGGENIHPDEIEQLAAAWPGVAEAVAVGQGDDRWGEVAVLVLVPRPGATLDLAGLQASFEGRLARFKHPRRVLLCDELPRTALGKVQRARLAAELMAELRPSRDPG